MTLIKTFTPQSLYLFICKSVRKLTCITQGLWLEAQTRVYMRLKKDTNKENLALRYL